ncbi:MAG: FAD-dependent oxidoreductase, partial [Nitrosarchaeum sp.]
MAHNFDLVIIGGGILGTSISYFLGFLNKTKKIAVIEQTHNVAFHSSGRNTGKVHAPYLYNPEKKKMFAKTAFHGYEMLEEYS